MSRRRRAPKRVIERDPEFGDVRIAKFTNYVMLSGKKDLARQIVNKALAIASREAKVEDPKELFSKAIENVSPQVEVKSRRIGGSTYQVPIEVRQERQFMLACNWIIGYARSKKGQPMHRRLANMLTASYKGQGEAVKKKEDVHKMAEANKAFAHFRF